VSPKDLKNSNDKRDNAMKKPNILYLQTHDCGRFISPYGYDMPTPNMMAFAKEGAVFRNACCASPTCSPSRAALLFGQYGHVNGVMGLAWMGDWYEPKDFSHHLVRFLKTQDYQCALAGNHHVSRDLKKKIGYDRVLNSYGRGTPPEELDDAAALELSSVEAADRFFHEDHEHPFFLSVGFEEPHSYGPDRRRFSESAEVIPPDSDAAKYARPFPIYPDNPVSRSVTANFQAATKILDDKFGAVLDALERSGHKDDTLVIMTTDHGAGMPDMKGNLTDWGIGIFLMMRGPGIPKGEVLDGMVSHVDIFPTICDYLGAEKLDWLQGTSMMPMLRGEADEVNDCIYAEQGYHGCPRPLRAIRTQTHKLIRCYKTDVSKDYYSVDAGDMFEYWMERGLDQQPVPEYALYDLIFDPLERCNQAENPAYKEVLEDLKQRLDAFMRETGDPLVNGELPPSPEMIAKQTNPEMTYDDYRASQK
jgi:arylsulfatase A-like enzyme